MARKSELVGQTFGRLHVLAPAGQGAYRVRLWHCRCACGQEKIVSSHDLTSGRVPSCGCWRKERIAAKARTHGQSKTPEYQAWARAKNRCHNRRDPQFPSYGARGISMHPEWRHSFVAFLEHIGPRPSTAHSLDRIDNDRGYEPGNVRWATDQEQQRNRRFARDLTPKLLQYEQRQLPTLMLLGLLMASARGVA